MNSAITQCPECSTRFRVSDEQLAAHNGMVRCGRCSTVFSAKENLHDDTPDPQLDLPILTQESQPAVAVVPTETSEPTEIHNPSEPAPTLEEAASSADKDAEPETLAQKILFQENSPAIEPRPPAPHPHRWPWFVASLLLLLLLAAQAVYFYRIDIAARLPGLKPALNSYCSLLACSIPLPQRPELMSIESSDLEADPQQASIITLSALLHNRAAFTQTYPSLELSLTDTEEKIVARRAFTPKDYLPLGIDEKSGLPSKREMNIKLRIDTTELNPSGYKLFLFYPK